MSLKTSNYGTARSILGLGETLLWIGIGLGILIALVSAGVASGAFAGSSIAALIPGLIFSLICFVGIVFVQMAKASVDTADYTYQMLGIARDQLAVSKQALGGPEVEASFRRSSDAQPSARSSNGVTTSELSFRPAREEPKETSWDYRDSRINYTTDCMYLVEGRKFETLEKAKLFLDGQAVGRSEP